MRAQPREIEVLCLTVQGLTNREIACQLGLSQHAARGYEKAIVTRLKTRNRVEAVVAPKSGG